MDKFNRDRDRAKAKAKAARAKAPPAPPPPVDPADPAALLAALRTEAKATQQHMTDANARANAALLAGEDWTPHAAECDAGHARLCALALQIGRLANAAT
jgi:hypothetical protein